MKYAAEVHVEMKDPGNRRDMLSVLSGFIDARPTWGETIAEEIGDSIIVFVRFDNPMDRRLFTDEARGVISRLGKYAAGAWVTSHDCGEDDDLGVGEAVWVADARSRKNLRATRVLGVRHGRVH